MTTQTGMNGSSDTQLQGVSEALTTSSSTSAPAPTGRTVILCLTAFVASSILTGMLAIRGGERFPGRLSAVKVEVTAPVSGTMFHSEVEAGRVVIKQQPLFLISDTERAQKIETARREAEELRSTLNRTKAVCELEVKRLTAEIDTTRFNVEQALTSLIRDRFRMQFERAVSDRSIELLQQLNESEADSFAFSPLPNSTALSPFAATLVKDVQEQGRHENDLESIQARITLCEKRIEELEADRKLIASRVAAANGLSALQAQLAARETLLSSLDATPEAVTIEAPGYGTLGNLRVSLDETVERGDVLTEVYDRDQELVEARLPSRMAPYVRQGMQVIVFFPGDEGRRGEVVSVPVHVNEQSDRQQESQITVLVKSTGRAWPNLPIGSNVEVCLSAAD